MTQALPHTSCWEFLLVITRYKMKTKILISFLLISIILASCTPAATPILPTQTDAPTATLTPTPAPTATLTSTPRPRIKPGDPIGFIKGIAYSPGHVPDWAYPLSDQSLQALQDTGASWVSLNAFVTHWDDPEVSRKATIHAIQEAVFKQDAGTFTKIPKTDLVHRNWLPKYNKSR